MLAQIHPLRSVTGMDGSYLLLLMPFYTVCDPLL